MLEETISYQSGDTTCKGFLAYDNTVDERRPGVLIAHAWRGLDEFAKSRARELARLGYVAFVADLYGQGKQAHTDEEAAMLMLPLFLDRELLQSRVISGLRVMQECQFCHPHKSGAIGFCFGGLAVIELLRSGTPVNGVVSFHAVMASRMGDQKAKTVPIAEQIKGSILALHGHDDPLVSHEDLTHFQDEFTKAHVDWQLNIYGHTSHAFTNPNANDTAKGLVYQQKSAVRAWKSMQIFFKELFT